MATTTQEDEMQRFTLEAFGTDKLAEPECDVNGELMVFDTREGAVGMARFILEAHPVGGRDGYLPVLGILEYDGDPRGDVGGDVSGWQCGFVTVGNFKGAPADAIVDHDGQAEEDGPLWEWLNGDIAREARERETPFFDLVEAAWYEQTKGDIDLTSGDDTELVDVVRAMRKSSREYVDQVDAPQWGPTGEIEGEVTETEIARRIALALSVLWFGIA